jgi:ribulose-5-phosphate 4-epimerase/fuculose-1-phosphate aldolase
MLALVDDTLISTYSLQDVNASALPPVPVFCHRKCDLTVYTAVCHAHPPHATAFSTLGIPVSTYHNRRVSVHADNMALYQFDFITHDSCAFYNDISFYSNFGGVVLMPEEGERIVKALCNSKAVILQNHGPLYISSLNNFANNHY